jgi:competence protein ComEA
VEFAGVESLSGRRGVAALAVLAALGLAGGYAMAVRARPKPLRIPLASPLAGPRASAGPAIEVHVAGAVAVPGLYTLRIGARVDDAVRAAGGARAEADLDAINLASKLRDGTRSSCP